MQLQLDNDFGYIITILLSTFLINFWHSMTIGTLRKKHGIKYPLMWSEKHPDFNLAQRVHQNQLENLPFFCILLFCASLRHTCWAAGAGGLWVIGRIIYSIGYYSAPEKRIPGAFISFLFGLVPLFGMGVSTAAGILGFWWLILHPFNICFEIHFKENNEKLSPRLI